MPIVEDRPMRTADVGWLMAASGAGVLVLAQLVGTALGLVFGRRGLVTIQGLGGALAAWWFAKGSWLRTVWGRPPEGASPPWDEPVLTRRRAGWSIWLGAACVAAASVAVGIQALHWVG